MIIGIPKELKDKETRVGLIPKWVQQLVAQGHTVYFQKDLALPAGISNEEYMAAGAQMLDTMAVVYEKSDMIVKFKDDARRPGNALPERSASVYRVPYGGGYGEAGAGKTTA